MDVHSGSQRAGWVSVELIYGALVGEAVDLRSTDASI